MVHFLTCLFNNKQRGEERVLSEDTRVVIAEYEGNHCGGGGCGRGRGGEGRRE